jgi:hypothetical protein
MDLNAAISKVIGWPFRLVIGDGTGSAYGFYAFITLVALLILGVVLCGASVRGKLIVPLVVLPAIPIIVGMWGVCFSVNPQGSDTNPGWVGLPVIAAPWLCLIAGGFFVWRTPSGWLFTVSYSLINFYVCSYISFIAVMSISGTWI